MSIVKRIVRSNYIYFLAFFSAPMVLMIAYALRGVYPFGSNSVLALDLNAQYIYYYEYFREIFLGDNSLLYSFSRTLGGEMIGTYAYYLASPFSFVILLFPKYLLTEAILFMILLKVGAAALTFSVYLRVARKSDHLTTLLFSLMYGLMSYNIVQTMNPMWLDGPIFFPLIILSLEQLIDQRRYVFYTITLALMFTASFYIGYMVGIFVIIYFFYYLYSSDFVGSRISGLKASAVFLISSIFAVCGSLWLLLPTYYALQFGKFGFSNPNFMPKQKLDIFDLFSKMLPLSYDSINVWGFPFIYCGLLTLILLFLYFTSSGIDNRKKFSAAFILSLFFFLFTVSSLDTLLHGFQEPVWLNYRYSFVFSFFLLIFAYEALVCLKPEDQKTLFRNSMILLIITAFIGRISDAYLEPEKTIWLSYVLIILYSLLIYYLKIYQYPVFERQLNKLPQGLVGKKILQAVLLFVVIIELLLNTIALIDSAHSEVYYSDRKSYRDYFDQLYPAVDYLNEIDKSFFRTETVMRRTVNDPMALGIYGVSHSSSVLNQSVIDLMYRLGFASREHWTRYKGATPVTDSLLGIHYILAEEPVNNYYEEIFRTGDVHIYRNPYAMPIAFAVAEDFASIELDSDDPFANQNFFLSTMLGDSYTEYFKLLTIKDVILENIEGVEQESLVAYRIVNPSQNAHIEYIIATAEENEMFMYLVSSVPRKVNIWLEHTYLDTFFDYSSTCIIPLGSNPGKESVSLITTPIEGEYYLTQNLFYYLDRPLFESTMAKLSGKKALVEKLSETSLHISTEVKEGEILFTSIPYDQGWQATVDGEKVEIVKTLDSLLAVKLNPGTSIVALNYFPRGLKAGIIVSVISWTLFAGILAYQRFSKKSAID